MQINLAKAYKRWRHGRGFGVHSPFAYDFITRTLREKLPYYAYERIEASCAKIDGTTLSARRIKQIFRILVRFNPKYVMIYGKGNAIAERIAIKAVSPAIAIGADHDRADVVLVNDDASLPPKTKCVYIFPDTRLGGQSACEAMWDQVRHGMRFDNAHGMTVIVTSPAFPRQRFEAKF